MSLPAAAYAAALAAAPPTLPPFLGFQVAGRLVDVAEFDTAAEAMRAARAHAMAASVGRR